MSMLQEEYNLTDEGLKQLLYDIRHPSMEAAIRHEKMYKTYDVRNGRWQSCLWDKY